MTKVLVYFISTFAWSLFLLSLYPSSAEPQTKILASSLLALGVSSTIFLTIKD